MTEEYEIVEQGDVKKNCDTCVIKRRINKLGMSAEASKLVQTKCLFCKYSKNAALIESTHRAVGITRPLEDNWAGE